LWNPYDELIFLETYEKEFVWPTDVIESVEICIKNDQQHSVLLYIADEDKREYIMVQELYAGHTVFYDAPVVRSLDSFFLES
jgi:hypothetical protein